MTAARDRAGQAPQRLRGTAIWWIAQARLRSQQLTRAELETSKVRHQHYAVLATIVEAGPASQAALARMIGLDRSDMVAVLNDLAAEGYVDRNPDPADRRRNIVRITSSGRAALRRFDRMVTRADDTLLAPLTPAERTQLRSLLERIVGPLPGPRNPADP